MSINVTRILARTDNKKNDVDLLVKGKIIDKYGNIIRELDKDIYVVTNEGDFWLVLSDETDKYGIVDNSGNEIIKCEYKFLTYKSNYPYIIVCKDTGYGLMDKKGNIICDCIYKSLRIVDDKIIINEEKYIYFDEVSYELVIQKGNNKIVKSFDNIESREKYYELVSKEIQEQNDTSKEKRAVLSKDIEQKREKFEEVSMERKCILEQQISDEEDIRFQKIKTLI